MRSDTLALVALAGVGALLLLTREAAPVSVVLDPGHGGPDPGATRDGIAEKALTLAIAQRAAAAIRTETGLAVRMTRTSDVYRSLEDRVRASAGAELFISVHCNVTAEEVCSVRGAEAYTNEAGLPFAGHLRAAWWARAGLPPWRFTVVNDQFYVVRNTHAARALLLECGYLCNPADLTLLADPAWQASIAAAIAFAVRQDSAAWTLAG